MDTKAEEKQVYKFQTKSLDEFAVMLALGAEVAGIKREEGDKFLTFILRGDFDMEKIVLQHASKTLCINSVDICEAMRRAKSVCHSH